jgi:hypothetical protein
MQRSRISQLIPMRSIGYRIQRRWIHPAIPEKWRIVGPAPRDLDRMTCRQRRGEDSSTRHLADIANLPNAGFAPAAAVAGKRMHIRTVFKHSLISRNSR